MPHPLPAMTTTASGVRPYCKRRKAERGTGNEPGYTCAVYWYTVYLCSVLVYSVLVQCVGTWYTVYLCSVLVYSVLVQCIGTVYLCSVLVQCIGGPVQCTWCSVLVL